MYGFELEEMLGLGEANAISKKDLKEDPFFQEKHIKKECICSFLS